MFIVDKFFFELLNIRKGRFAIVHLINSYNMNIVKIILIYRKYQRQ